MSKTPQKIHGTLTGSKEFTENPVNRKLCEDAGIVLPPTEADWLAREGKEQAKDEDQLQRWCETHMESHGFLRMTANNYEAVYQNRAVAISCAGFYGHLYNTRGGKVPILPDIFAIAYIVPCAPFLCELKVPDHRGKVKYEPGQFEMIELGVWELATDYDMFRELFAEWREAR